ncbi:hypothetical protein LTR09_005105 [Extremus antarcticus]|uniref:Uncharacterized protein n=1 Tax=Extremus antarcticus TaxID=702011 RepID=A0AAJ0DGT6_9PEZI|nr:hypothetical protein LTR09_005105 [Extremus antarcticus]
MANLTALYVDSPNGCLQQGTTLAICEATTCDLLTNNARLHINLDAVRSTLRKPLWLLAASPILYLLSDILAQNRAAAARVRNNNNNIRNTPWSWSLLLRYFAYELYIWALPEVLALVYLTVGNGGFLRVPIYACPVEFRTALDLARTPASYITSTVICVRLGRWLWRRYAHLIW